jgi:hypothetical protein
MKKKPENGIRIERKKQQNFGNKKMKTFYFFSLVAPLLLFTAIVTLSFWGVLAVALSLFVVSLRSCYSKLSRVRLAASRTRSISRATDPTDQKIKEALDQELDRIIGDDVYDDPSKSLTLPTDRSVFIG